MNDTMKAAVLAAADATLTDWFKWAEVQTAPTERRKMFLLLLQGRLESLNPLIFQQTKESSCRTSNAIVAANGSR